MNLVLHTLAILASGYIIHNIFCKFKYTGHTLYFRVIITGLSLLLMVYAIVFFIDIKKLFGQQFWSILKVNKDDINIVELAPFLIISIAFLCKFIRFCYELFLKKMGMHSQIEKQRHRADLKGIEEKGFSKFIHNAIWDGSGIEVTLDNDEIIFGWVDKIFIDSHSWWIALEYCVLGRIDKRGDFSHYDVFTKTPEQKLLEEDDIIYLSMNKIITIEVYHPDEFDRMISEITKNYQQNMQ